MFYSPKGHVWACDNAKCLAELDEWADAAGDTEEARHCAFADCHGVVWTEKAPPCSDCGAWYCLTHLQNTGNCQDDDTYICATCYIKPKPTKKQERQKRLQAVKAHMAKVTATKGVPGQRAE
jgi:hypothetical protein